MQQVKGSVLKARLAFVEQHGGMDGVERVLGALSAEDRAALRNLVAIQWCPFELGRRLDDAIVQALGHGKPQFFERLGAASAETNLTTVHRAFLAPGDPQAFLAKAPQVYKLYYDTGRREYAKTGPNEAVLTTLDAETFSVPDCLTVIGWHRKALEMCGAANVKIVEEECRARGGAVCRYRASWT
ncbi:MAG TPA: TIGR02265 family protein [Gemmatimonadales bacterium]|nr:TIGR02265 family protein [Gemmatimonadales bacterium]